MASTLPSADNCCSSECSGVAVEVSLADLINQQLALSAKVIIVTDKTYGAVGDGVNDDTAAINNALAAASGYTVIFPKGTYKISGRLNLPTGGNVRLLGVHDALIQQTVSDTPIFYALDHHASNYSFEGLTLRGNGNYVETANPALPLRGEVGIFIQNSSSPWTSNVIISRCKFLNNGAAGVNLSGITNLIIRDCYFEGTGTVVYNQILQFGIYLLANITNYALLNNRITRTAIGIFSGHNNVGDIIRGNQIYDLLGQHAIYCSAIYGGVIEGNVIRNVPRAGIKAQLAQASLPTNGYSLIIANNTIDYSGNESILVLNAEPSLNGDMRWDSVIVANNVCRGWTSLSPDYATSFTIYLDHISNGIVTNNVLMNRYRGFEIRNCQHMTVAHNRTYGMLAHSFEEVTSDYIYFYDNIVTLSYYAFAYYITSNGHLTFDRNTVDNIDAGASYSWYFEAGCNLANVNFLNNVADKNVKINNLTPSPFKACEGNHIGAFSGYPYTGGWSYNESTGTFAVGTTPDPSIYNRLTAQTNGDNVTSITARNANNTANSGAMLRLIADSRQAEVFLFPDAYGTARRAGRMVFATESGAQGMAFDLPVGQNSKYYVNAGIVWRWDANGICIGTDAPASANSKFRVTSLNAYANNAAALAAGLQQGDFYRSGGDPDLVCVVH